MLGLASPYLSLDEIESERSARAGRERHSSPPMPVLIAPSYVHTGRNETVIAPVPLAWPSIADHDAEVNLSVTQFLFTLQHLYDVYTAWGGHEATWQEVKDTFNELVERWHTVRDSYDDCCGTSAKEIEQGLDKIRRLCYATFNHKGPNWNTMSAAPPPPGPRQQSMNYPAPSEYEQTRSSHNRSSTRSSTRGSERREGSMRSSSVPVPQVQTAVTRLLVATKQLLESLTNWSRGTMTETDVSDVYVQMGNDFNSAVAAFQASNIDMSDLMSVPDDLRAILEQALAEEATPENLELYLPSVRTIIKNLLHGLRAKQHDYKLSGSRRSDSIAGHDRSDSITRSERPDRMSSMSRSSTHQSTGYRHEQTMPLPAQGGGEHWVGGFAPPQQGYGGQQPGEFSPPNQGQLPNRTLSRSSTASTSQQPYGRGPQAYIHQPVQEEMTEDESSRQATPRKPNHARSLSKASASSGGGMASDTPPRIQSMAPQLPLSADIRRYSLIDGPVRDSPPPPNPNGDSTPQPQPSPGNAPAPNLPPPPNVLVEPNSPSPGESVPPPPPAQPTINRPMSPSPPPDTPTSDSAPAELNDKALSALKSGEALTRRASKRFSTYTYNKMTGTPSAPTTATSSKNRRSMMAGSGPLSTGDLNALSEIDEAPSPNKARRSRTLDPGRRGGLDASAPPVPPLPPSVQRGLPSTAEETTEEVEEDDKPVEKAPEVAPTPKTHSPQPPTSPLPPNRPFTIFLQLESQVRKAEFEPGMTIAALRVLFVEKFQYNPGLDNFPDIYIRDPASQVMYELEDINEVKEKSLLSLNIEPLGQIKQHIDSQMNALSQDLRELKSSVANMKRMSVQPTISTPAAAAPELPPVRPTEDKFQKLARRLSSIRTDGAGLALSHPPPSMLQPQPTGASMMSHVTNTSNYTMMSDAASVRIVSDLKNQFDEIVMLRRDLGVMRQMYVDFVNQTKSSISNMRTQAQTVRQLSGTKVSGDRAYIVAGREKLDSRTTTLLTKVEELQDNVENLRHDVVKRHVTPRPAAMKLLKETISSTATELQGIQEYIATVQPMWKQTWARELAGIVEEQEFLRHMTEFVEDLAADHAEVVKIFEDIQGVVSIRPSGQAARTGRMFRPAPAEDGKQAISNVLLQIRGSNVDPEQRMRAIEASQRQRKMDLATRSDAFTQELSGYVQGKKLKLTGGAEEAERVRQKRNDVALKAMFGVGGGAGVGNLDAAGAQHSPSRSTASGPSPQTPSSQLPAGEGTS
ncbi:Actin-interacting protein 3 homolog [Schizosaccharomyces pombe 972h-] [Rhizoctonia solani]|uniref:Actin-interacting protein 3 homolog [Schizosaccharomyces pombe 972h-] n=1 Tax=Rhizoctonia solani TaxID=456999 RepID=A0A0K6GHR0_9AGAM|nr:Actin-interacting protein 3 homolog [Schizosaccharomyces pombe 972h-] [Rhizoctonia solani]